MSNKVINRIQNAKKQLNENTLAVDYSQEKDLFDEFLENFDIRDIPKEVLEKQYVDYFNYYIDEALYSKFNSHLDILIENLNNVEDIDVSESEPLFKVIENINKQFRLGDWQTYCYIDNTYGVNNVFFKASFPLKPIEDVVLTIPNIKHNFNIVDVVMRKKGYMLARWIERNVGDEKWLSVLFNPVEQNSINNYIVEHSKYLYHTTEKYNDESIVMQGFVPSERNLPKYGLAYKHRVFFKFNDVGGGEKIMTDMLKEFAKTYHYRNPSDEFYTYILDAKLVANHYKLYRDPNAFESCYSKTAIDYKFVIEKRLEIIDDKYIFNFKE